MRGRPEFCLLSVPSRIRIPTGLEPEGNQLHSAVGPLDRSLPIVDGGERIKRGHTNGPRKVSLPRGYLDDLDDVTVPDDARVMALSGG